MPAAVGETHGDGAEKQTAFGFADDGLTVCPRSDDEKLSKTVPVAARLVKQNAFLSQKTLVYESNSPSNQAVGSLREVIVHA